MTFHSQLNTFHSQLFLESHNPFMVPVSTNQIYTHFKSGFKSPSWSLPNVPRHNVVLNSTPVSSVEADTCDTQRGTRRNLWFCHPKIFKKNMENVGCGWKNKKNMICLFFDGKEQGKSTKPKQTNKKLPKNKTVHFSQGLCFFVGFCFSKIQFQDPILLEGRSTLHKKSLQHTRHLSINCSISSKKILQDYIQTCSHYLKNMQVYVFL